MKDLIYNQHSIPKEQWRYGLRSSAATGCGWIAAYNALRLMGYYAPPEKLIRCMRRQLPLIHGNMGTSLWGPGLCFHRWGFLVKLCADPRKFDREVRDSDVAILFYRWRRGWRMGAHFVAVRATERGFVGYNTFRNSTGEDAYGSSLRAFLKKQGYFGCVLTTIRDRRSLEAK